MYLRYARVLVDIQAGGKTKSASYGISSVGGNPQEQMDNKQWGRYQSDFPRGCPIRGLPPVQELRKRFRHRKFLFF